VTIESIISKDNFVTNIVLAQITILAYEAPVLCEGGTVEVVYSAADLCTSATVTRTFTLTAPPAVAVEGLPTWMPAVATMAARQYLMRLSQHGWESSE